MNRAQYIQSLFEYDGPATWKHKAAGVALGVAGLGAAALVGHAAAKGHSLQDVGNWAHSHSAASISKNSVVHHYPNRTTVTGPLGKEIGKMITQRGVRA